MSIDRRNDIFSFVPKDMYFVSWNVSKTTLSDDDNLLTDSTYNRHGVMLAGLETDITAIPTVNFPALDTESVIFKGAGRGYFKGRSDAEGRTKFKIKAYVDFLDQTVSLTTSESKLCRVDFSNCNNNSTFNFVTVAPISYAADDESGDGNGFSGAIESSTLPASGLRAQLMPIFMVLKPMNLVAHLQ